MRWLSIEGIIVISILLLSAIANILFILNAYFVFIKIFNGSNFSVKIIYFLLSVLLCVPFIMLLHRFTILFMLHRIAYLWLLVMIIICVGLAFNLRKLYKK